MKIGRKVLNKMLKQNQEGPLLEALSRPDLRSEIATKLATNIVSYSIQSIASEMVGIAIRPRIERFMKRK